MNGSRPRLIPNAQHHSLHNHYSSVLIAAKRRVRCSQNQLHSRSHHLHDLKCMYEIGISHCNATYTLTATLLATAINMLYCREREHMVQKISRTLISLLWKSVFIDNRGSKGKSTKKSIKTIITIHASKSNKHLPQVS